MAVHSQALHNGALPNAECLKCWQKFADPTGQAPCPNCGEEARIRALPSGGKTAPAQKAKATASTPWLIGVFALIFGGIPWLEGARTTRDGWVIALNWVLDRLALPFALPAATAWTWWLSIGAMVALGLGYSLVELRAAPLRLPKDLREDFLNPSAWYISRSWQVWLTWIVIIFTDVVTMYLGARAAGPDDPVLLQQIAAARTTSWIYAIIITFIPDRLIRFGWRSMRG